MQLAIPCVKVISTDKVHQFSRYFDIYGILLNLTYKVRKDEDETNAFYDNRNINPNLIGNLSLLLKIQKQMRRLTIED